MSLILAIESEVELGWNTRGTKCNFWNLEWGRRRQSRYIFRDSFGFAEFEEYETVVKYRGTQAVLRSSSSVGSARPDGRQEWKHVKCQFRRSYPHSQKGTI